MRAESRTLGHDGFVGVLLGAVVALTYGSADFLGGLSSRRLPVPVVLVVGQLTGLLLIAVLVVTTGDQHPTHSALAHGAAAGLAGFVGLSLFFQGLATGSMSVIAPITAMGSAVVPFAWAVVAGGERPGVAASIGVVLAVVGVAIVSRPPEADGNRPRPFHVARAGASGAAFGLVFVLLGDAGDQSGLYPVLASRLVSFPLAVIWLTAYVARTGWRPPPAVRTKGTAALLVSQGVLDSTANSVFIAAAASGLLSEVSVVSALYPAPTVVLAAVVLHERISRVQRAGLALVLAGVALIAT
jgi:drug/metabolite transporter (DMT)-like permease